MYQSYFDFVYNIFILFLLVFCFPIPVIGNSVYLAIFLALTKLLYQGKISKILILLKCGYACKLLVWTIAMVIFGAVFTIINCAFEFSRSFALFSLLIGLISVLIIYPSLSTSRGSKYVSYIEMEKLLVAIFIVQAIISILSFISPNFKTLISHFQFSDDANLAEESYAGIRGLALSGRLYFEFAATCGLIVIFQIKRIVDEETVTNVSILLLILLIICGFFAGRTALVGLGIGIGFLLLSSLPKRIKFKFVLRFILILISCFSLILFLAPTDLRDFIFDHLLPWVFDVFIKLHETGSTEDSVSFNGLNQMYENVVISGKEWIYGSGIYTEESGRYYGHVDAGYLRQILYWGLAGTLISLIYTLKIFQLPWKVSKHNKNQRLFLLILLVYTLVVHYKGDLLSISRFYYVILFLYFISMWQSYKQKNYMQPNHSLIHLSHVS